MKELMLYAAKVILCSGIFMLFFRVAFFKDGPYLLGRIYLIAAMLLSLVIPALAIPVYPSETIYMSAPYAIPAGEVQASAAPSWLFSARLIILAVYLSIAVILFVMMLRELAMIRRLRKRSVKGTLYGYSIYRSPYIQSPFSFGRSVYVNDSLEGSELNQVILHEISHIRHLHPAEKTFMSAIRLLQWYNPFVWLACRQLRELHEYEADDDVLAVGFDRTEYQKLIFKQVFGYNPDITCGLNNSLTKKRFIMMTKPKRNNGSAFRMAGAALLVGGLVVSFGFTRMPAEYISTAAPEINVPAHISNDNMSILNHTLMVRDSVYNQVEEMPEFPGGNNALMKWIATNVKYPREALDRKIEGVVVASFIVDASGEVRDIKIIKSPDESLSKEVSRVLSQSPKWRPGRQDGKYVNVNYVVPVNFSLPENDKNVNIIVPAILPAEK